MLRSLRCAAAISAAETPASSPVHEDRHWFPPKSISLPALPASLRLPQPSSIARVGDPDRGASPERAMVVRVTISGHSAMLHGLRAFTDAINLRSAFARQRSELGNAMTQLDETKLHSFIGKMLGDLGGAFSVPTVRIGEAAPVRCAASGGAGDLRRPGDGFWRSLRAICEGVGAGTGGERLYRL